MMLTTDLSLKKDPEYAKISKRFHEKPEEFEAAFAKAWFKLTHRDLGPRSRYVGPEVPEDVFSWQDPIPAVDHALVSDEDIAALKQKVLESGLEVGALVRTSWASASTFRGTDMRGGANGARVRLAPQKDWTVNNPEELGKVLTTLEGIQADFNGSAKGGKQVSLADLIVIAGAAAVEKAASDAGLSVTVPVAPGRADATQEQTDETSFAWLEPEADGFRNYYVEGALRTPADALVDKAARLELTVPEMTALVGGLRVLGGNAGAATHGVLTNRAGQLTNDFFVNLLDRSTSWSAGEGGVFEGRGPDGGARWTATEVDLVFGSNAELRAVAEHYAYADAQQAFAEDFVKAWVKVMQSDRFDLHR